MDIILYLLQIIQYLYQLNCWLMNFICRYIPLKQWAFDDSHSPKYQKFRIDEFPLVTDFRRDWTYKELIPYYEKRYGKKIRPVRMLMYGKEATNRKQETDRQHHTIPYKKDNILTLSLNNKEVIWQASRLLHLF